MAEYAHPDMLASTAWAAEHSKDANVRLVEVDVDTTAYEQGHAPGAIAWNWSTQLSDGRTRDIVSKAALEKLLGESGIDTNTIVLLYGDNNNWFAAWALWQLKIYGHKDVRLVNGGRKKWLEEGRELTADVPAVTPKSYTAGAPDWSLRAYLSDVQKASAAKAASLVDVRSPAEYSGEIIAPPGLPETAQRGGHIPSAASIPWGQACNDDGTFKSADDLKALYGGKGVDASKPAIAYCRIGERSSHTWFVLKYLLGINDVKNYDGSWTEWGNLVGAPIEK